MFSCITAEQAPVSPYSEESDEALSGNDDLKLRICNAITEKRLIKPSVDDRTCLSGEFKVSSKTFDSEERREIKFMTVRVTVSFAPGYEWCYVILTRNPVTNSFDQKITVIQCNTDNSQPSENTVNSQMIKQEFAALKSSGKIIEYVEYPPKTMAKPLTIETIRNAFSIDKSRKLISMSVNAALDLSQIFQGQNYTPVTPSAKLAQIVMDGFYSGYFLDAYLFGNENDLGGGYNVSYLLVIVEQETAIAHGFSFTVKQSFLKKGYESPP